MPPAPRRCLQCSPSSSTLSDGKSPCSPCYNAHLSCQFPRLQWASKEHQTHLPNQSRSTRSISPSRATTLLSVNSQKIVTTRPRRTATRYATAFPMDEAVAPSLVAKAACAQQIQLYTDFVMAAFPCYFKVTEKRVPVNWVEYVGGRCVTKSSPFDWAIRSLTTIYTGSLHKDPRYLDAGRECYLRSLRGLSSLLDNMSTALSDEALSAAIALTVFEMHACTTPEGWIHHASGIRALMRLRGPQAHLQGFGCALYIAIRNTLVTAALVAGEACFLEEPEWQELNEMIAAENAKRPDSSVYTDITERAFREVVRLPGFVKRMKDLPEGTQKRDRPALLRDILATRAVLRGIHTEFSMSVSTLRAGREPQQTGFIGPLPHHFFDGFSSLSMQGIRTAILISNYLIILLDPSQRSAAEAENRIVSDQMGLSSDRMQPTSNHNPSPPTPPHSPDSPGRSRLMIESQVTPETRQPPTTNWMDRIATTMGLEGVRVSLVDEI